MAEEKTEVQLTKRDVAAKWWRQVGFWGLTVMIIAGFPVIGIAVVFFPESDTSALVTAHGTNLAAWTACAGIRQWGKNQGSEEPERNRYGDL